MQATPLEEAAPPALESG